jgi:hypothetical protein
MADADPRRPPPGLHNNLLSASQPGEAAYRGSPARRGQRQQRSGLAVWFWGGTVVSTWVT